MSAGKVAAVDHPARTSRLRCSWSGTGGATARDQFAWTSRSTQLLDRGFSAGRAPMFHYGALAAVGGHVIGLCIPSSGTDAVGISEGTYRWIAAIAGGIAGAVTLIGFVGLRLPAADERPRQAHHHAHRLSSPTCCSTVLIVLGCWMTFAHNLVTDAPYNYRASIGVWWRSLFYLNPDVAAASSAPIVYQVHAIIAWLFWASFPFSRLVHAWSIPLQYLGRPYILYRRRYSTAAR